MGPSLGSRPSLRGPDRVRHEANAEGPDHREEGRHSGGQARAGLHLQAEREGGWGEPAARAFGGYWRNVRRILDVESANSRRHTRRIGPTCGHGPGHLPTWWAQDLADADSDERECQIARAAEWPLLRSSSEKFDWASGAEQLGLFPEDSLGGSGLPADRRRDLPVRRRRRFSQGSGHVAYPQVP